MAQGKTVFALQLSLGKLRKHFLRKFTPTMCLKYERSQSLATFLIPQ